jgi:hypothetical protein
MATRGVTFSIINQAAWAPGLTTPQAWRDWAARPARISRDGQAEPGVAPMPAMLRRRAGFLGKMALEVAYQCLEQRRDVPSVFVSRHGDAERVVGLLGELARGEPLSPTGFGMTVHNAHAGLFSIARADRAQHIALAAGASSVEHAVIEACGLLADGAPLVLLVVSDCALPTPLAHFEDCDEQPHAWAWLMAAAGADPISLSWSAADAGEPTPSREPAGLAILRFQLGRAARLERLADRRRWCWTRGA